MELFITIKQSIEQSLAFLVRESLFAVGVIAFLTMQGKIGQHLAHAIGQERCKAFVTKYALMLDVGEHLADEFALLPALRASVSSMIKQTGFPCDMVLRWTFFSSWRFIA
jgi:hypothetical protein